MIFASDDGVLHAVNTRTGKKVWTFKAPEVETDDEKSKTEIYASDSNGNPYSPDWMIYSLKSTWEFSKNWQFTAGVENLLDKRYRPYSSGIVSPGRNFVVSLKATI